MTLPSIALYSIPALIGVLIVHLIWDGNNTNIIPVKIALGIGIGIGITSLLYFIFLFTRQSGFLLFLFSIALLLIFISIRNWQPFDLTHNQPLTAVQKALFFILVIIIIINLATFISISMRIPHGSWDSWAIWNRVARFIFRSGQDWQRIFSSEFNWLFHADYPLLVPLTTAWVWDVLNVETQRVPMIQAGIYLFVCGLLLFSALYVTRSFGTACIATTVLLANPEYTAISSIQIADTPLAIFIAATAIIYVLYEKYRQPHILVLAGITTALAAWTKNEGFIFLAGSLAGLFIIGYKNGPTWRLAGWYFTGIVLPLTIVLFHKLALAPTSDIYNQSYAETMANVFDFSRYADIGKEFGAALLTFGGWGFSVPAFLAYYVIMKKKGGDTTSPSRGIFAIGIILLIQLLGYFATYVVTPHDLEWHLAFSLTRIIYHIFPTALFLLFLVTDTPESIFAGRKSNSPITQHGF
ncbi:MAG TPA: hypothetical protein VFR47_25160 [Anaerolineales bacterium]|nr:hypothetical protein [Anaerolineales bacterium]